MSVLDAGCGSGAITAGIARAVGSSGHVLGIDRDEALLDIARQQHAALANLEFRSADILAFEGETRFDVVSAARVLQWISNPLEAIRRMAGAAKPGGLVIALDYTHEDNTWDPAPPREFQIFWQAFLDWRRANGWDNRMAEHLPHLFAQAGLERVETRDSSQTGSRGDSLWLHVIETLGPSLVAAGYLTEERRLAALEGYSYFIANHLMAQRLAMSTVEGRTPART